MNAKIVFLSGAPSFSPGLLFKMFVDIPGVKVFYQPLRPHVDLFARYSNIALGDSRIPPGYYSTYSQYPGIFSRYPINNIESDIRPLLPFLHDCINASSDATVFDLSGFSKAIPFLMKEWPEAIVITGPFEPEPFQNVSHAVSVDDIVENYLVTVKTLLAFCNVPERDLPPIFFSSDWVQLCLHKKGLGARAPLAFCDSQITREDLECLFRQKETIVSLARGEAQIRSLETQLAQIHVIASERLDLIGVLDGALTKLKSSMK